MIVGSYYPSKDNLFVLSYDTTDFIVSLVTLDLVA